MADEVVCTKADSGEEVWRQALDGDLANAGGFLAAPPVAAGGELFVAVRLGDDRFTGWSHWGGNAARTGVAR